MAQPSKANLRVAVVQAGPVFLDKQATLEKALCLIERAAKAGAKLILFPEVFFTGYPRGLGFGTAVGYRSDAGRELFARYYAAAIEIPGPETEVLAEAAGKWSIVLAAGVTERERSRTAGTLYCTLLLIDADGQLLGTHRKLKPTAAERIIWGEGQAPPKVFESAAGRIGGLICWENYMPEARMALYRQGVEIYLAPTADSRDSWQATIRHIACEGRCFVLSCNQFMQKESYPEDLRALPELQAAPEPFCPGGSAIIDPFGGYLAGPAWKKEKMLVADLDRRSLVKGKFDFDAAGHYDRPDMFPNRTE